MEPDAKPDAEIKVFVLGNGGAGKTTLVGRLRDLPFDSIPKKSTHGLQLIGHAIADADFPHPVQLNFWDFGGQDVYHGTHALFLRSPAIFILLYSKKTENEEEDEEGGIPLRNRPLRYWFDYLLQVAGEHGEVKSPVLITQSQCDKRADEDKDPPYTPAAGFPKRSHLLHVSSKCRDHRLEHFSETLRDAVLELLEDCPQPPFPESWARVRQELRDMLQQRLHRTLLLADLADLCREHGCAGDETVLRDALHQMGAAFYRRGLFGDQIILDQSWVLESVYTVFSREKKSFQRRVRKRGRFTRADLHHHFWQQHSVPEQQLFLSFMVQCGICFKVSGNAADDDIEYVAPDLLGPWGEEEALEFSWQQDTPPMASMTAEYTLLHDGIIRGFLSQIGRIAGNRARYWKYGCHLCDQTSRSQASIRTEGNKIIMRCSAATSFPL